MPRFMKLEGMDKTVRSMKKLIRDAKSQGVDVIVGYTQNYAIYVHENLEARHAPGKQAKYLEGPAKQLAPQLGQLAVQAYKSTGDLPKALMVAGLRLLRASQEVVPIDTGALRASGFVALEKDLESASQAAKAKGDAIRQAEEHRKRKKKK